MPKSKISASKLRSNSRKSSKIRKLLENRWGNFSTCTKIETTVPNDPIEVNTSYSNDDANINETFSLSDESLLSLECEQDNFVQSSMGDIIKGRRIVNLAHVLKMHEKIAIHPYVCTMGKMKMISEVRKGIFSFLNFFCDNCDKKITITTESSDSLQKEVNEALVWSSLSVGIGFQQCEELFGIVDVWEDHLQEKIKLAGEEERQLAIRKRHITNDGVPYITVIGDGGWSKRSYGHGYNASSGVGIIIGAATKKPLFLGVRNKVCSFCNYYKTKNVPKHDCSMNFKGPSTAMEQDIIVQGFYSSIEQHGLM